MIVSEKPQAAFFWNLCMAVLAYAGFCAVVAHFGHVQFNAGAPFVYAKMVKWEFPQWFFGGMFGSALTAGMAILFSPFAVKDVYGGAHLATEKEIRKDLGLRATEGLVLGRTVSKIKFGKHTFFYNARYLRMNKPLSVLCYAPPGSGKTAGVIIPSLLALKHSTITMDPKGEIFKITARHRSETFKSKIVRFAPGEPGSARWNPLSRKELPKSFEETQTYVGRLAEALIVPDKPGEEDMWTRDARAIFRFWALFLIWRDSNDEDQGETSLGKIISEATGDETGPQGAFEQVFEEYGGDPKNGAMPLEIQKEGAKFVEMADKQFDGVYGTFSSKMDLFLNKTVADNLSTSDFCFKELREKVVSIYFVVAIKDMGLMKPIISLFFQVATDVFLGEMPKKGQQPITFFLDEFVQMGKMPKVLGMPAVGRGYLFNAVYIVQSVSQLQALYGKDDSAALRNTTSYHIVFAQNEEPVALDISKSIGKRTRTRTTRSDGNLIRKGSDSDEGIELVKVQDIMSLPWGQILLLVQGHFETPVRAEAAFHFDDRTMMRCLEGQAALIRPDEGQAVAFDDGTRMVAGFKTDWQRGKGAVSAKEMKERVEGPDFEDEFQAELMEQAGEWGGEKPVGLEQRDQVDDEEDDEGKGIGDLVEKLNTVGTVNGKIDSEEALRALGLPEISSLDHLPVLDMHEMAPSQRKDNP